MNILQWRQTATPRCRSNPTKCPPNNIIDADVHRVTSKPAALLSQIRVLPYITFARPSWLGSPSPGRAGRRTVDQLRWVHQRRKSIMLRQQLLVCYQRVLVHRLQRRRLRRRCCMSYTHAGNPLSITVALVATRTGHRPSACMRARLSDWASCALCGRESKYADGLSLGSVHASSAKAS